jgi:hypothetical protein
MGVVQWGVFEVDPWKDVVRVATALLTELILSVAVLIEETI